MVLIRKAVWLVLFCTLFTSAGQILWKYGLQKIDFSVWLTIFNLPFLLGFFSYGTGIVLMLMAFKEGELTVIYPILATSYVWVCLISPYLFPSDHMNTLKWAGAGIILISVSLLGFNGAKDFARGRK